MCKEGNPIKGLLIARWLVNSANSFDIGQRLYHDGLTIFAKIWPKKRSFTTDAWMSPAPLPEVHWTEEYGGAGTLEPIPCPRAGPCTEPVGAVQTEPVPLYNLYGPCVSWRPHQCHPLNSANNVTHTQYRPIVSHWVPILITGLSSYWFCFL